MQEDLERLNAELAAVLHGLDARQTQCTPAARPEKWSIQQIVEHLLLSYRSTVGVLRTRLEKGTPTQAKPTLMQRFGQFYLISLGHFPNGRKAPPMTFPAQASSFSTGAELAQRADEDLLLLDGVAAEAEQLFGGQRCASHLVLGPLSVEQWRRFHLVHGEHHIQQIRKIRRDHQL